MPRPPWHGAQAHMPAHKRFSRKRLLETPPTAAAAAVGSRVIACDGYQGNKKNFEEIFHSDRLWRLHHFSA